MNNIKTTDVVDPSILQPFTAQSLTFLQEATREAIAGLSYAAAGFDYLSTGSTGVAIAGCNLTAGGNTMSYGYIFHSDELFFFPGASGILAMAPTAIFTLNETNSGYADPVQFTDLVNRNVHKVRRLQLVAGVGGSGLFDLSALINIKTKTGTFPSMGAGWTNYSSTVKYLKSGVNNAVSLRGIAEYTWAGVPQIVMFTLPADYRPTADQAFLVQVENVTTPGWSFANVWIRTNGNVEFFNHAGLTIGNVYRVYLDSINFYLAW